jgi:hypothetical protein
MADLKQQFDAFRFSAPHQGITFASEWVQYLRKHNQLLPSGNLDALLRSVQVDWWVKSGEIKADEFPAETALQAGPGGTQEYVWSTLKKFVDRESGVVHSPLRSENDDVFQQDDDVKVSALKCFSVSDAHLKPSFGTTKPHNVHRCAPDATGAHTIVVLGDNRRGSRGPFIEEEVGRVLSKARQLLTDHQKRRSFMYCYLSDGNHSFSRRVLCMKG